MDDLEKYKRTEIMNDHSNLSNTQCLNSVHSKQTETNVNTWNLLAIRLKFVKQHPHADVNDVREVL